MSSVSIERPAEDAKKQAEEATRHAAMLRNRMLQWIPLDTEGINTPRLDAHREEMQASKTPLLFLSSSNFRIASLAMELNPENINGMYDEARDIAIVRRNLAYEALNGAALTESFGIHEIAHGTHLKFRSQFRYGPLPADKPPTPYASLQNSLWEEGYAEYERGLYVQKHGLTEQFTADAPDYTSKRNGLLPSHYLFKQSDDGGRLHYLPGAPAAAIFELLNEQNDTILPLFRKSRHEYMGAIELAKTVDEMMPGLRHSLLYAPYDRAPDILELVYKRFGKNHTRKHSINIDL